MVRLPLILASAAFAAALGWAPPAAACLACIEMPQQSLADRVLAAEAVALLRPMPDDPFRFAPTGFLRGGPAVPPVPFLVSRSRAAELAADPQAAVVGTWSEAEGWAVHDFGGPALAEALADLLARDLSTPAARRDAFAPLVPHPDPAVARMAMVEMARLPYPVLRQAGVRIDRRLVADMAADPHWAEWAPAAIVLLGLSDDPADAAFLRRTVADMARDGRSTHLAAWATALIEVDGHAIEWLEATYGGAVARDEGELRQIGLAMAGHAMREDRFGTAVRAAMAGLAERSPAFTAAVAGPLMDRGDWSLVPAAARWTGDSQPTASGDAYVLTHYLLAAAEAGKESAP